MRRVAEGRLAQPAHGKLYLSRGESPRSGRTLASFVTTPARLVGRIIWTIWRICLKSILPDGSVLEYSRRVRPIDIAAEIGPRLAKATLAAEVDGQSVGADSPLPDEGEISPAAAHHQGPRGPGPHAAFRAPRDGPGGDAAVRGRAVGLRADGRQRLLLRFPAGARRSREEDFPADRGRDGQDRRGGRAVRAGRDGPRGRRSQLCSDLGQSLKVEHLEEGLADEATVSFYRQGEFIDLCRGPHVPSAGAIGAFKLLSVAGAYWKGDASRQQLQRLYGTALFTKQDLDDHLKQLEEAKRRDHRVLGKQLELFMIDPAVGSGLVLWLPKGAIIRRELENFLYGELIRAATSRSTRRTSAACSCTRPPGHYPYYNDSQFPPIEMADGERYLLQADELPAPHHDLPVEAAELPRSAAAAGGVRHGAPLRAVGRAERHDPRPRLHPGRRPHLLHRRAGGRRVPRLHRDDAVRAEDPGPGRLPRAAGLPRSDERQVRGQRRRPGSGPRRRLEEVCREMDLPNLEIERGEAAFYGPKADFVVADCIGREWQLGTVQFDYNLPSPSGSPWSTSGPTTSRTSR